MYHKLGRDLVEQVDGNELLGEEDPEDEMLEVIGKQFLHAGGPASGIQAYQALDDRFARQEILPRISDEIIEEHAKNPIGKHSDDLQRVLHYFRRASTPEKYIIVETERNAEWAIGRLSGTIADPPEILDERYNSVEEATHEIFLKRIAELREEYGANTSEST